MDLASKPVETKVSPADEARFEDLIEQGNAMFSSAPKRPLLYRWIDLPQIPRMLLGHLSEDQRKNSPVFHGRRRVEFTAIRR